MKATQRDFRQVAPRAARDGRVFFFCGPDEAGASAAAQALVALLPEPGERVELSGGDVRSDPVLLADEARSNSLFGGARHIWVRASGDEAHDAVKNLLDTYDSGEGEGACPVHRGRHFGDRQVAHRQAAGKARRRAGRHVLPARPALGRA